MTAPKNILLVRTDRIGDLILSLPLAGIIKEKFPAAKVSFLVRNYTKPLVDNNPDLDDILVLSEEGNKILIPENVKKLRKHKFEAAIIIYPTFITAVIIFLSGIKIRIGSGYRWYSILFNRRVFEHRKYAEKHELEYNVNLLKELGIDHKSQVGKIKFRLNIDDQSLKEVNSFLLQNGFDERKKTVIIHPGSGGSSVDWPMERFSQLIQLIDEKSQFNILITGDSSESSKCQFVAKNSRALNLAGKFDLKKLVALISKADLFISNSTGPMHIAAALGKFTIGFFPKIPSCSAKRWGAYSEKSFVFEPPIDCKNCNREQCARLNCMNTIESDLVFDQVNKIFSSN
jgi:lipopolysaccharide heptosyltransferase II